MFEDVPVVREKGQLKTLYWPRNIREIHCPQEGHNNVISS